MRLTKEQMFKADCHLICVPVKYSHIIRWASAAFVESKEG